MPKMPITREEHIERHKELHESLDELLADFLTRNPNKHLSSTTIMELITWSHAQTLNPTEE